MNVRLMILSTVVASSTLFAVSANAHDPREFDRMMGPAEAKTLPATCTQLANSSRYSNDVTNPDIKALKTRCDAEAAVKPGKTKRKSAATKTK